VAEDLIETLKADRGIVCLVGAGGKKTTMARLASLQPNRAVGLSSTVFCAPLPDWLSHTVQTGAETALLEHADASRDQRIALAWFGTSERPDRHSGLPPTLIPRLHQVARRQVTLVKADGARMRRIKAPGPKEPVLATPCDAVIALLSIKAIGRPLDEKVAHRPDRIADTTGLRRGQTIGATHLARLLTHPHGLLQGLGDTPVTPVINMVDNTEARAVARRVAEAALADTQRFDRVVLASMRDPTPLVEIVGD